MGYHVSRQAYYYSQENVVEVESNGLDYSGSDTLVSRYPGEGREYEDPKDAIEAAIRIRDAWRLDEPDEDIHISYGQTTGGMGMEHEPDTDDDDEKARAWAARAWEELPKCDECGDLREKTWRPIDDPDLGEYCSESCCERAYERNERETEDVVFEHLSLYLWWDESARDWVEDPRDATTCWRLEVGDKQPDGSQVVSLADAIENHKYNTCD